MSSLLFVYFCFCFFFSEAAFDLAGRPLEPAFYTGFPAYHNLIYVSFFSIFFYHYFSYHWILLFSQEIYECSKILQESDAGPHTGSGTISSKPPIPQTNSIPTEADKSDSGSDLGSRSTEFILKSQSDSLQADPNLVSKKTSSSIDEEDMVLYAEDMFREDGGLYLTGTKKNIRNFMPTHVSTFNVHSL